MKGKDSSGTEMLKEKQAGSDNLLVGTYTIFLSQTQHCLASSGPAGPEHRLSLVPNCFPLWSLLQTLKISVRSAVKTTVEALPK